MPQTAALRIDAAWIVPIEPEATVLSGHSLMVDNGAILDILPTPEAALRYEAAEHVALPGHALIPGLVNLHTHAAMTLLRGFADDLPLMTWLQDHIWPAEKRLMSHDFVLDGSLLACLEMLKGGITCFNDMYFFPEATAQAAIEAGQRVAAGIIVIDFPSVYAADPDGYLQRGVDLRDQLRHEPLVSFCLAPHAPYSIGDRSLAKVATYAAQLDLPVHMHIHETDDEIRQSVAQYGLRPLDRLHALGLLGPQFIGVHAVHLNEAEIDLMARHGCHVAHCPSSNLKLASGLAPVAAMLERGLNVGLGTDGAASNNRLDAWEEMRLAALLAKGVSGRPEVLPAHQALHMATLGSARALGLDARIGSLQAGKQADVVAVSLEDATMQPCYDIVSQMVYSAGRAQVDHVWVGGRQVVRSGACTTLDESAVIQQAHRWHDRLRPA